MCQKLGNSHKTGIFYATHLNISWCPLSNDFNCILFLSNLYIYDLCDCRQVSSSLWSIVHLLYYFLPHRVLMATKWDSTCKALNNACHLAITQNMFVTIKIHSAIKLAIIQCNKVSSYETITKSPLIMHSNICPTICHCWR